MSTLDLSRWQFGITTVYHFVFVPLTIGLAPLVAIMQTFWHRTRDERWLRLTRFFGGLFLVNFAIGVVTGIVQEFQFGMNWSAYSRFVGDVFGAPLAMEGLAAFFVESTFIGLWIFGWDRLPGRVHLACIWLAAIGVNLSAYFIIAANSFMQHPVGVRFNPESGRAELTSIRALLTNSTALAAIPHTVAGAFVVAGTFVGGISLWWTVRRARAGDQAGALVFRPALRVGLVTVLVAGVAVLVTGDAQSKLMFEQQPMKMAAAEALCDTESGAGFSLLAVGDVAQQCDVRSLTVPGLTSWLATGDAGATLQGVNDLQRAYEERYGAGVVYVPPLAVTYWSFRLMIGLGAASALLAVAGLWLTRGNRLPRDRRIGWLALAAVPFPFLANVFGWVFTEIGRQPWVVAPNPDGVLEVRMLTADGVSGIPAANVAISLTVFTLLYGALAVVWFRLIRDGVRKGVADPPDPSGPSGDEPTRLSFAY